MKARFLQPQPPLDVRRIDGKAYCYICANGIQQEENVPGSDGAEHAETVYEYDYNEIVVDDSSELLAKIEASPADYVDYTISKPTDTEKLIEALMNRIAALENAVTGG